jgi:hypothetical protein
MLPENPAIAAARGVGGAVHKAVRVPGAGRLERQNEGEKRHVVE